MRLTQHRHEWDDHARMVFRVLAIGYFIGGTVSTVIWAVAWILAH